MNDLSDGQAGSRLRCAGDDYAMGGFSNPFRRANVTLLAVDEAHCVSEWGHDFRPDYARLGSSFASGTWGDVQTIALTATATPTVRARCLLTYWDLKAPQSICDGVRPGTNLHFSVQPQ